ncbi:MAG: helix-hairpin-helix domain-containing protein [Fibromonadaceae bacterium]|jgi:competence protein ComEA|nr:helix-hairpin-helix domain-containing protein [Fibromonadaceae bacterium]
MNAAEKKFLFLALFLFALGGVSHLGVFNRLSPLELISLPINPEFTSLADSASLDSLANDSISTDNGDFTSNKKEKKPKKKAPAFPLSINTASKEDLCFIKGVGPSLAQKIVEHREAKGSFRSGKDLEKVSGIGAKKRMAIEEFVKFD